VSVIASILVQVLQCNEQGHGKIATNDVVFYGFQTMSTTTRTRSNETIPDPAAIRE
jgi:hypothetical protein